MGGVEINKNTDQEKQSEFSENNSQIKETESMSVEKKGDFEKPIDTEGPEKSQKPKKKKKKVKRNVVSPEPVKDDNLITDAPIKSELLDEPEENNKPIPSAQTAVENENSEVISEITPVIPVTGNNSEISLPDGS